MTQEPPYSALEIARFFLERSKELSEPELSKLKLNRLVFLAHGWYLGIKGKDLIDEDIRAWKSGPVVKSVYRKFRDWNNVYLPYEAYRLLPKVDFPKNEKKHLFEIWEVYKDDSGNDLARLTRGRGTPWYRAWRMYGGDKTYDPIVSWDDIQSYYERKWKKIQDE